jgi:arylsulfatase A-like enzyme
MEPTDAILKALEAQFREAVTIAQVLQSMGYATGQFGKNHLGDHNEFLPTARNHVVLPYQIESRLVRCYSDSGGMKRIFWNRVNRRNSISSVSTYSRKPYSLVVATLLVRTWELQRFAPFSSNQSAKSLKLRFERCPVSTIEGDLGRHLPLQRLF